MTQGILAILDSRSFGSIWFWLLLALAWTLNGRRTLGVPADVIRAVRPRENVADAPADMLLLDWLSLTLPRWQIGRTEGLVTLGVAAFALTALFVLGFFYGLEMAQALVLLILPFALLFLAELRLSRRLSAIVNAAEARELAVPAAAAQATRLLRRHRMVVNVGSILAVAVTAYRGALWLVTHPFGF